MSLLEINGRKGLKLIFDCEKPEKLMGDVSLYGLTQDEVKKALKKPFFVKKDLYMLVNYKDKGHCVKIPANYRWNGANIPPCFWLLIGQKESPRLKLPSCVHDFLCENHNVIDNDRYLSTLIFETLCNHFGKFNAFKRWSMFHAVDNYQKVFGKWKKSK